MNRAVGDHYCAALVAVLTQIAGRHSGDLIACPTCHALLAEPCRTRTGARRAPHGTRLVPQRCRCGGRLPRYAKLCPTCSADQRRENTRDASRRLRARRKVAA